MYRACQIIKWVFAGLSALAALLFAVASIVDKEGKQDYEAEKAAKKEVYVEKYRDMLGLKK